MSTELDVVVTLEAKRSAVHAIECEEVTFSLTLGELSLVLGSVARKYGVSAWLR